MNPEGEIARLLKYADGETDKLRDALRQLDELQDEHDRLRELTIRARWLVPFVVDIPQAEARAKQWLKDTVGIPTPGGWW